MAHLKPGAGPERAPATPRMTAKRERQSLRDLASAIKDLMGHALPPVVCFPTRGHCRLGRPAAAIEKRPTIRRRPTLHVAGQSQLTHSPSRRFGAPAVWLLAALAQRPGTLTTILPVGAWQTSCARYPRSLRPSRSIASSPSTRKKLPLRPISIAPSQTLSRCRPQQGDPRVYQWWEQSSLILKSRASF